MLKKFWNVTILDVDPVRGKLTIYRKKREAGQVTHMLTTVFVGSMAKIKDTSGKRLKLSDIEPRDRATLGYMIESGMLIASHIVIDKYEGR